MNRNDGAPYPLPAWQQHLIIAALAAMCGACSGLLIWVIWLGVKALAGVL